MVAIFLLFGGLLGSAGVALAGAAIVLAARHETGPALLGVALGCFVLYAAYLFGRVAFRVRREALVHPLTSEATARRRRIARGYLALAVAQAVAVFAVPMPGLVRVVGAIIAILVVPLVLASEFEPWRRERTR
jgi:hypothetical protein